jgi:hypothetical protein
MVPAKVVLMGFFSLRIADILRFFLHINQDR